MFRVETINGNLVESGSPRDVVRWQAQLCGASRRLCDHKSGHSESIERVRVTFVISENVERVCEVKVRVSVNLWRVNLENLV